MKSLLSLIVVSLLLAGCGPSKQEVLRLKMLEAQRIEAAAQAARQKAAQREQRIVERRQQAYETLQNQQVLKGSNIQELYSLPNDISANSTYFFNVALQPEKYNYADNKQGFTIIGMRQLNATSAFADLINQWQTTTVLELSLLEESPDTDELVSVIPNIKQHPLLENKNPNWAWDQSLFTDLTWNVSPEKAWPITSTRNAYIQIGLRFCNSEECIKRYTHKDKTVQALAAKVMSVLIVDKSNQKVLAEFIYPDL